MFNRLTRSWRSSWKSASPMPCEGMTIGFRPQHREHPEEQGILREDYWIDICSIERDPKGRETWRPIGKLRECFGTTREEVEYALFEQWVRGTFIGLTWDECFE